MYDIYFKFFKDNFENIEISKNDKLHQCIMHKKQNNQQRVELNVSWLHVLLMSNKIPWIQKKLLWNVVYAHSQVCSSSKINDFECPRLCPHGLKKCELNFDHGSFCIEQKSLDSLPSEKIMFCGLISLCTIPVEWRPSSANKICLTIVWMILFSLSNPLGKSWTSPKINVSTWNLWHHHLVW